MATNANLPSGAFLTTIGGKKCTAVPLKKNDVTSTSTAQTTSVSSVTTTTTSSPQATTTVDATTSLATSTTATAVAPPPPQATSTVLQSTTTAAITTTAAASTTSTSTLASTTSVANTQTQASPPEAQLPAGTTRTTQVAPTSTSVDTPVSTATSQNQTSAQTTTTPPVAVVPVPSQGTTTTSAATVATTSQATPPANTQNPPQAPDLSPGTSTAVTTTSAEQGTTTTAAASPDVGSPTSADSASQATTAVSTNSDGALVPLPVTSPGSTDLPVSPAPDSTETAGAANPITTTNASGVVVTQTPSLDTRPQETALASTSGSTGMTPQATAAIAGGVAGSVVLLALLAFLFCWCRRRRRKNGSVPSTPTYSERSTREKEPYVIMRSSIGPTPATEKIKANLHYRYKQALMQVAELGVRAAETVGLRKRSDVDLDRGLSQYGPLMAGGHSRSNSGVLLPPADQPPKREYPDWWDRLTEDGENWHIKPEDATAASRTGSIPIGIQSLPSAATMTAASNPYQVAKTQPATQGNLPAARAGQPREAAQSDHFLSKLGLNIDNSDPFSDANSMSHVSAMVMPLAAPTEQNQNPFSDANTISKTGESRGPSNYVQGVQHARQESYGAMLKRKQTESVYRDRESTFSQESFQTRRNRVKSDPFDLDRLVGPLNNPLPVNTAAFAINGVPPTTASIAARQPEPPQRAHVRQPSTTSSKYSSGVESEAGWSDPGPDVGPSISRAGSKGSMGSIGKAK